MNKLYIAEIQMLGSMFGIRGDFRTYEYFKLRYNHYNVFMGDFTFEFKYKKDLFNSLSIKKIDDDFEIITVCTVVEEERVIEEIHKSFAS